jgi:flagellar biosynthesis/type III secretory pathway chaperone
VSHAASFKDSIAAELAVMAELAAVLESEYALTRGEPTLEELELAHRERRRLSLRLLDCRQRRLDFEALQSAADADLWNALRQAAIRCRDLNERVGALVAARLHHLNGLLTVLGGTQRSLNYAADARIDRRAHPTLTARA